MHTISMNAWKLQASHKVLKVGHEEREKGFSKCFCSAGKLSNSEPLNGIPIPSKKKPRNNLKST